MDCWLLTELGVPSSMTEVLPPPGYFLSCIIMYNRALILNPFVWKSSSLQINGTKNNGLFFQIHREKHKIWVKNRSSTGWCFSLTQKRSYSQLAVNKSSISRNRQLEEFLSFLGFISKPLLFFIHIFLLIFLVFGWIALGVSFF